MKRTTTSLSAIAVLATVAMLVPVAKDRFTALPVVHAKSGCSVATLKGNYGMTFSGFLVDNGSQPFYGEGLLTFDGAGYLSGTVNFSENGVPSNTPYTATYTVNLDCTGVASGTNGSDSLAFVILDQGVEVLATDISAPDTMNADFKKQDRE